MRRRHNPGNEPLKYFLSSSLDWTYFAQVNATMRELYNIFSTSLLTIISLLVIRVADAEPCQGSVRNDAYSGIYTCWDPTVVLVDPTIQCDPDTCLWDLDALDPANPPGPCEAVRLVEEQLSNLSDLLEPCLWWEMLYGDLGHLLPEQTDAPVAMPSQSPVIAASLAPSSFVGELFSFCTVFSSQVGGF